MGLPRLLLAALVGLPGARLFPQTPTVVRTETRVVLIHVEVNDSHRQPVPGLSRDAFTVTDSGKPREIRIFSVEGMDAAPAVPPSSTTLPLNVFSNHSPAAQRPAHATVILLDAINNYWDDLAAARQRLIAMVGKLREGERIAVYVATTRPAGIVVVQDFTTDRVRLLRSIQAFRPPPISPAPGLGHPTGIPQAPGMNLPPPVPPGEGEAMRRLAVLDTMSAFRTLSGHLGKLPGRKSLLWLTSGLPPKQLREMPDPYERAAAALNEANVAVNVLDDDGVGDPHRRWGSTASWTLQQFADSTGGKAYVGRNDLENMLVESIQAPRVTYTLGFYLPDDERDDKFHPLQVRVNRPHLNLSYRKGYYAGAAPQPSAPKKREPLENTLLDAQDSADIAITAAVNRLPGASRPTLRIVLRLAIRDLSLRPKKEGWSGKVEEMFLETNAAGQVVAKIGDSQEFQISPGLRERFDVEGVPIVHDIRLMEEATRLLIISRDSESGRTGSLSVPLGDIPLRP